MKAFAVGGSFWWCLFIAVCMYPFVVRCDGKKKPCVLAVESGFQNRFIETSKTEWNLAPLQNRSFIRFEYEGIGFRTERVEFFNNVFHLRRWGGGVAGLARSGVLSAFR